MPNLAKVSVLGYVSTFCGILCVCQSVKIWPKSSIRMMIKILWILLWIFFSIIIMVFLYCCAGIIMVYHGILFLQCAENHGLVFIKIKLE